MLSPRSSFGRFAFSREGSSANHGCGFFRKKEHSVIALSRCPALVMRPPDDLESAIVATLPPGAYTAIVAGKNETMGVALLEVYHLP